MTVPVSLLTCIGDTRTVSGRKTSARLSAVTVSPSSGRMRSTSKSWDFSQAAGAGGWVAGFLMQETNRSVVAAFPCLRRPNAGSVSELVVGNEPVPLAPAPDEIHGMRGKPSADPAVLTIQSQFVGALADA